MNNKWYIVNNRTDLLFIRFVLFDGHHNAQLKSDSILLLLLFVSFLTTHFRTSSITQRMRFFDSLFINLFFPSKKNREKKYFLRIKFTVILCNLPFSMFTCCHFFYSLYFSFLLSYRFYYVDRIYSKLVHCVLTREKKSAHTKIYKLEHLHFFLMTQ